MPVPDQAVLRELDRIVDSGTFRNAERLRAFLRFVVKETLAGRQAEIKEYAIGCRRRWSSHNGATARPQLGRAPFLTGR